MTYIHNSGYTQTDFLDQAGTANLFGVEATSNNPYVDIPAADQTYGGYYTTSARDVYWYRFIDQSPYDSSETVVSSRTVASTATCISYDILSGGYGNEDPYVIYHDPQTGRNVSQYVYPTAPGCATWLADSETTCGPRCTKVDVLLTADNITGSSPVPRYFSCNNTVGDVTGLDGYWPNAAYRVADEQARLWAGAIGFSGFSDGDGPIEYVRYDYASDWSPTSDNDNATMAELLMSFTAGAFSAYDTNGPRVNATGYYPTQAQVVDVDWKWSIALLAGIPGIQFLVLLAVLIWANKVIIKDTSHLATARLLRPVVEKLGDKGCLLTGDEIAETLGNYRLKYGVRDPPQNSMAYSGLGGDFVRHVDVIEETEGLGRADARMANGLYDGTSTWYLGRDEQQHLLTKRGTRRLSL